MQYTYYTYDKNGTLIGKRFEDDKNPILNRSMRIELDDHGNIIGKYETAGVINAMQTSPIDPEFQTGFYRYDKQNRLIELKNSEEETTFKYPENDPNHIIEKSRSKLFKYKDPEFNKEYEYAYRDTTIIQESPKVQIRKETITDPFLNVISEVIQEMEGDKITFIKERFQIPDTDKYYTKKTTPKYFTKENSFGIADLSEPTTTIISINNTNITEYQIIEDYIEENKDGTYTRRIKNTYKTDQNTNEKSEILKTSVYNKDKRIISVVDSTTETYYYYNDKGEDIKEIVYTKQSTNQSSSQFKTITPRSSKEKNLFTETYYAYDEKHRLTGVIEKVKFKSKWYYRKWNYNYEGKNLSWELYTDSSINPEIEEAFNSIKSELNDL